MWVFVQWWASISFAVMTAAYLGRAKLSAVVAAVMVIMFTLSTLAIMNGVSNQVVWIDAAYGQLAQIGQNNELSHIAKTAIAHRANNVHAGSILNYAFFITSYVFTLGFILYCWRSGKKEGR